MRNTIFAASLCMGLAGSGLLACSGENNTIPFGGSAGSGGSGNNGGDAGSAGSPIESPQFAPAPGGIRRLLGRQYINSIRLVLGDPASKVAAPPPDPTYNEFETLAAAELATPPSAVEAYETSAREVAKATVADSSAMANIVPCVPLANDDAECFKQVIEGVGHQLWRRPLTPEEVNPIVVISQTAGIEYTNFNSGVEYALLVLLQSPYFLYTVEVGVPDPDHPEWFKLTSPELATRMSLFLVDSIPDAALLEKSENGGLDTDQQVRDAAHELLTRPGARTALTSFYDVIYKLRDLPTMGKDTAVFPEYTLDLASSMRQETLLFLDDLVWNQNADYRDVFTANYTFVDDKLAALYGMPSPGAGFQKVTIPSGQFRTGIVGHASHLTRNSHSGQTSPTRRGVWLSNFILCSEIPPPPPGVDITFPPFDPNNPMTKKQFLEQIHHEGGDNCKSCHQGMDPYGYAFESFNGIGKFRTMDENGLPIDPTGDIVEFGSFANAEELAKLVRDDPRSMKCIVKNLFKQSMGHEDTKGERPAITAINTAFEDSGYKLQEALVEIVASPAFAYVDDPK